MNLPLRLLRRLEEAVIFVVAVALIAAIVLQVLSRYALGQYMSLAWTDEVARGLLGWLTFIGAAALEREHDHIRVTLVVDLLGPAGRRLASILSDVFCTVFLCLVLVTSVETLKADAAATMIALPLPVILFSIALTLGSAAMLVHVLVRLWGETVGRAGTQRP